MKLDSERERLERLLGLFLALLVIANFLYLPGVYPHENMLVSAVLLAGALGMAGWLLGSAGHDARAFLNSLAAPPSLAGLGLAVWALTRWRAMAITSPGRDGVISLLWMGVAIVAGTAAGVLLIDQGVPAPGPTRTKDSHAHSGAARPEWGHPGLLLMRRVLALAGLGFALYAFYQYFIIFPRSLALYQSTLSGTVSDLRTQSLLHALNERRVGGMLGNPNLFAAQLAIFGLFALSLLTRRERLVWRVIGGAGWGASLCALPLTGSRGGMLTFAFATGIGALILWISRQGSRRAMRKAEPGGAITGLFVSICLWASQALASAPANVAVGGWQVRLGNISTIRERIFYWSIALKIWARRPWIGEGPGGFQLFYLIDKSPLARESQYAHSWLMQTGAELGWVGVLLAIVFWLGAGWVFWRALKSPCVIPDSAGRERPAKAGTTNKYEAAWLLAGLALLAFNGLFEFSLQWRPFLVLAGLLAGLLSGICTPLAAQAGLPLRRERRLFALGLAIVIWLFAAVLTPPYQRAQHHRWRAESAADEHDWAGALANYEKAAQLEPDNPAHYLAQATVLTNMGDRDHAWPMLEHAGRLDPRSASVRAAQAEWLATGGQMDAAIKRMGEAIDRYPSNAEYRLQRARYNLRAGRAAEARADLEYLEKNGIPIWNYQQAPYNELRRAVGLEPVPF